MFSTIELYKTNVSIIYPVLDVWLVEDKAHGIETVYAELNNLYAEERHQIRLFILRDRQSRWLRID